VNSIPKPLRALARSLPEPVKRPLRWCRDKVVHPAPPPSKHEAELSFWEGYVSQAGIAAESDYYQRFMLAMGNITNPAFFKDKICLDVGCGPKGSLTWLTDARAAIGVDPLVEEYRRFGIDRHSMLYLACGIEEIPLASDYVDVVFSMNSLDHVDDLPRACTEIRRVLKPGGHFIGSLNLDEPPTPEEPWTLTEPWLAEHLFHGWEREFYAVRPKLDDPRHFGPYRYFFHPVPEELEDWGGARALWCRFRSPGGRNTAA